MHTCEIYRQVTSCIFLNLVGKGEVIKWNIELKITEMLLNASFTLILFEWNFYHLYRSMNSSYNVHLDICENENLYIGVLYINKYYIHIYLNTEWINMHKVETHNNIHNSEICNQMKFTFFLI